MVPYRILAPLAGLVLVVLAVLRRLIGRDGARTLAERLGGGAPAGRGAVWVHGASVGELVSARPLIAALAPDRVLVTANTESGRAQAEGWGLAGVAVRAAPVDAAPVLRRFLNRHRPRALVLLEGDLWPGRILAAQARGMPVLLVSARISERSARRWARMPGLVRSVLGGIDWIAPQDEGAAARLQALGVPADRIGAILNLKAAGKTGADATTPPGFVRASTVLAASTHPGEEAVVLEAFAAAHASRPDLRLILAPRHPDRGDAVAHLIAGRGLAYARRSEGAPSDPDRPVYLADTLGEMALWYAAAGLTFVGGSLVPKGGHTPFEPEAQGSAILHGPDTSNFPAAYAALRAAGAAVEVRDAAGLAAALLDLADPGAQTAMAARATAALAPLRAGVDLAPILDRLHRLAPRG